MSQSVTQNELNAIHQTCHQRRVPGGLVTYCFWWKSEIFLSAKPEVELILTIAPTENMFTVKYLENGEKYDVRLKGGQIANGLSIGTIILHSMTLNRPDSRSQDFGITYLEYGARYDVGHNGGQIGINHPWAFHWDL